MPYYLVAAGLVLHAYFWGVGLSWLIVPRLWRRWWWVFAPVLGLALQSAFVWYAAHTTVKGANGYAWWSELLPLSLIGIGLWRQRIVWSSASKFMPLALLMVVAGWFLISPMAAWSGGKLTSSSLGSCDHADYAAGARVLQEYSRNDQVGFLGLTEVTQVGAVEGFFEYFVILNHFTPSAIIAHNGTVFGYESHQLVSITGVVFLLLTLPLVAFAVRVLAGVRGWLATAVAGLYAFSPLNAYAVHHAALGQLMAAGGIALLTLSVVSAGQDAFAGRSHWRWLPLVVVALWILAGSYNFILTICLAPAGGWLALEALRRKDWRGFSRSLFLLAVAIGVLAVCFWGRLDGLAERFRLFEVYNFGWPMALLTPEGWLGLVQDFDFAPLPPGLRVSLGLLLGALWVGGLCLWLRRSPGRALLIVALVVPVLAGWALLAWESRARANASYDAYKLIGVFLPCLLAGLLGWLGLAWRAGVVARTLAIVAVAGLLAANLRVVTPLRAKMANPPLRVDGALLKIRALEQNDAISSLNLRVEEFWSRLWANTLLLEKPHYFLTHTYEARLNTELKGEWDLSDSLLRTVPRKAVDFVALNERFFAVRVRAEGAISAEFGAGWHGQERNAEKGWRWNRGEGTLILHNPADEPVRVQLVLRVRAISGRELRIAANGHQIGQSLLGKVEQEITVDDVVLVPGRTELFLTSPAPPESPPGDGRALSFALYRAEIRALPDAATR